MDKKDKILFAGVGLVIVAAIVTAIALSRFINGFSQNGGGTPAGSSPSAGVYSATHTSAPANAVAPNEGSAKTSANVAVPSIQATAAPGSDASYRSFGITITNNAYSPSTIIVNQGDTVNLEVMAADANYGFTQPDYGFNDSIKKGKTQTIQFQALTTGKFTFFCSSCGGPAKGPVGYIIVTNQ